MASFASFNRVFMAVLAFSLVSASHFDAFFAAQKNSGDLPKELARKFKRDAVRLALRLEAEKEDLRYSSIYVPQGSVDQIFGALAAIYQGDDVAKRLEKCNIHTFPNPSIDHLVVVYDKNIGWAEPLRKGISETNSSKINGLLTKYSLAIEKHVNWTDQQDAITIRSSSPLNIAALAAEFESVEGVAEIDLGVPKILGHDILARRVAGGWEFDYVLRFGSWSTGKGKSHIWKFRFLDSGKVQFNGESGDEIPTWMQCRGTESEPILVARG